jgi:hypothetical protein
MDTASDRKASPRDELIRPPVAKASQPVMAAGSGAQSQTRQRNPVEWVVGWNENGFNATCTVRNSAKRGNSRRLLRTRFFDGLELSQRLLITGNGSVLGFGNSP